MEHNMFDDCQLATSISTYLKKIHVMLEDNFDIKTMFACAFDEKPNSIMILDIPTGELIFRERTEHDKNRFNSHQVIAVHYFIQIAVWMIYNTLIDQQKILSVVFDNFYDYMFGPIMTSIVFYMDSKKKYTSELPSIYLKFLPLVTVICE